MDCNCEGYIGRVYRVVSEAYPSTARSRIKSSFFFFFFFLTDFFFFFGVTIFGTDFMFFLVTIFGTDFFPPGFKKIFLMWQQWAFVNYTRINPFNKF